MSGADYEQLAPALAAASSQVMHLSQSSLAPAASLQAVVALHFSQFSLPAACSQPGFESA